MKTIFYRLTLVAFLFGNVPSVQAASEREFELFRQAMIVRQCKMDSTLEILSIRQQLKWSEWKISEVMLQMAIQGQFACPGGCILIDPRCPKQ